MPDQYLLTEHTAKQLQGRVVKEIVREKDKIRIEFEDGTAITIEGDRPEYGRLMVYVFK